MRLQQNKLWMSVCMSQDNLVSDTTLICENKQESWQKWKRRYIFYGSCEIPTNAVVYEQRQITWSDEINSLDLLN